MKLLFVCLLAAGVASSAFASTGIHTEVRIRNAKCEIVGTNAVGVGDDVTFWAVLTDVQGQSATNGHRMVWELSYTGSPWASAGRISDGFNLGETMTFGVGFTEYELNRTFTIVTAEKDAGFTASPKVLHVVRDTAHLCK